MDSTEINDCDVLLALSSNEKQPLIKHSHVDYIEHLNSGALKIKSNS